MIVTAQTAGAALDDGPYKVLKTARVGGEGGWDYIFADSDGRRLYSPRGAIRAIPATDKTPEVGAIRARLTVFDLDSLKPAGRISGIGGHGTARPRCTHIDALHKNNDLVSNIDTFGWWRKRRSGLQPRNHGGFQYPG